jgi:hypothetical protein
LQKEAKEREKQAARLLKKKLLEEEEKMMAVKKPVATSKITRAQLVSCSKSNTY